MKKRSIAFLFTLCMLLTLLPAFNPEARAAEITAALDLTAKTEDDNTGASDGWTWTYKNTYDAANPISEANCMGVLELNGIALNVDTGTALTVPAGTLIKYSGTNAINCLKTGNTCRGILQGERHL